MNEFSITTHGDNWNVDEYLKNSKLKFSSIWHRNDKRGCEGFGYDFHPTSGVDISLGDGYALELDEQEEIAFKFITDKFDELKELTSSENNVYRILGFQYNIEVYENLAGFCMSVSDELTQLSLDVGLGVNFYVNVIQKFDPHFGVKRRRRT